MATPSRHEAMSTLREGQEQLDELLARLSEEDLVKPGTIGGGDWSAKDLIGHVAFWEEIAIDALADWRAGRRSSVEEAFAREGGVDELNARSQESTRQQGLPEVREQARRAYDLVIE